MGNTFTTFVFFFFLRFYLFIHERHREREAETQAEGEAGSMQGARCGTRPRVSRITPWAEGSAKPLSHPGIPNIFLKDFIYLFMRDTEREKEAETQAEGEAGFMQGAYVGLDPGVQDHALG